eukprot:m.619290 g.619290  ORF g.619290 m.619290 type:complete len:152 (+) comp22530_c0_seq18:2642-3097(+)
MQHPLTQLSLEFTQVSLIHSRNRMLKLNPAERITAEDALAHPYFAEYHDVEDEPVSESPFQVDSEIDDDADLETLTARIDEEVGGCTVLRCRLHGVATISWCVRYARMILSYLQACLDVTMFLRSIGTGIFHGRSVTQLILTANSHVKIFS